MKLKPGILSVYKPSGPTSHDIISELRRLTGIKTIGHAGTLDPLASGVLVVAIGREYTKQLAQIVAKDKNYLATIKLGETSTTDDAEGQKSKQALNTPPTITQIRETLSTFKGATLQVPPSYSAVKIKGQPAYKLSRRGQPPTLKPRKILIKSIKLLSYKFPLLKIQVTTGPGVYIRALARDLGQKLGTGAYLADLERTRVGEYSKNKALVFSQLSSSPSAKIH